MKNTKKLLHLCQTIAGLTVRELAEKINGDHPKTSIQDKGWIGKLLEIYLGATAKNLPIPDFPSLGVELKTIPISYKKLEPMESTYVCSAPFKLQQLEWHESVVKKKLSQVLWIPIAVAPNTHWLDRKIGAAFLWEPDQIQETILKKDWEELTEMLYLGQADMLTAHYGKYLQLRPKANNCNDNLIKYTNLEEEDTLTVARGFYLRRTFTKEILLQRNRSIGSKA